MFYRRSKISHLLFKRHILADGAFRTYAPGELISSPDSPSPHVHILIQGRARGTIRHDGLDPQEVRLLSGDLFEYRHLHLVGSHVGFIERSMTVVARSRVRAFSIPVERLERMSAGSGSMRQAWQAVIIAALAREAELHFRSKQRAPAGVTREAVEEWIDPSFAKLSVHELPQASTPGSGSCLSRPLVNVLILMHETFHPPWPFSASFSGLRHSAMSVMVDANTMSETSKFVELATLSVHSKA
jgi:CRP-like cAMP-binding protein